MLAIYKRELRSYFNSALGFIIFAIYAFFAGLFFSMYAAAGATALVYIVVNMVYIVFFLTPLITMKTFAEEKHQRTDQALFTAPVRLVEVVAGKYLAALTMFGAANLVFIIYAIVQMIMFPGVILAWSHIFLALLGVFFLGAALLAVNMFFSSITEHQIIAAVLGLATGLVLMIYENIVATVEGFIGNLFGVEYNAVVIDKLSVTAHFDNFVNGIFNPIDFVFFISWIALFLFLTDRVLDRKRWA